MDSSFLKITMKNTKQMKWGKMKEKNLQCNSKSMAFKRKAS